MTSGYTHTGRHTFRLDDGTHQFLTARREQHVVGLCAICGMGIHDELPTGWCTNGISVCIVLGMGMQNTGNDKSNAIADVFYGCIYC